MRRASKIGGFLGARLLAAFLSLTGQERRLGILKWDQIMHNLKLLAGTSLIGLFAATSAHAAGTASGSIVSNTATVTFAVGGVTQPTVVNTPNTFTVDRKVVFRVDETAPIATTTVAPGQTAAVTTFTVSNTSNATMDFGLSLTQQVGGIAAHSGTDNFDVTAPVMYADSNGNGTYEPATDTTVLTFLDEVLADTSRTVFVVANIPAGRATGDVAAVTLTGQARDGGAATVQTVTLTPGATTRVDPNASAPQGKQYGVTVSANGTIAAIVMELHSSGGDNAMIYGGFPIP